MARTGETGMSFPIGQTAQDIMDARAKYLREHNGESPNAIYLGHDDYYNLRRECCAGDMFLTGKRVSFRGMVIYRVDEARHLNVSVIEGKA